jgi:GT2 family glycosyltransferase
VHPKSFFLIINPDIYCNAALVEELLSASKKIEDIGIVEARQLPYEHPKGYDAQTMETNWASGSCMLLNPKFYNEVGGFDENFWMYCEDVDLSWRAWLSGYRVIHCPEAVAYHYTGGFFEYRDDRFYFEQLWGGVNYLYLSYKYWGNLRLWLSIIILMRQNLPKSLKQAIFREFQSRKRTYRRTKGYSLSLHSQKDKVGIVNYNCYK